MMQATGASLLGMPVARLLAAHNTSAAAKAKHVILFWNGGGMSHVDTWDPKPGRPVQGEFSAIDTSADGVQISSIFPNLAKQMHHAALIRSIAGTNGAHGRASYQLQTSYNQTPNLIHPGIGSIVVHEKERMGDLPSFITISGNARRAGYLGQRCEAYYVGRPGEKDPYLAFPAGINNVRGNKRLDILKQINLRKQAKLGAKELKAVDTATREAINLMRSPALKSFELEKENPKTLARYGDTDFGRGALLARKLVETGVRFVQINRGGFDTHNNNFPAMENHGLVMDPALASLVEDLATIGKLESTMVIMLSEFGRTPRISQVASSGGGVASGKKGTVQPGRDHWPRAFTNLWAGGGIETGGIIGSSDARGEDSIIRRTGPRDFMATLYHHLGIDAVNGFMKDFQGRPVPIMPASGKPVPELVGKA